MKKRAPKTAQTKPTLRIAWGLAACAGLLVAAAVWLLSQGDTGRETPPGPVNAVIEPEDRVHLEYAGSASCRTCHPKAFEEWQSSHHGLAECLLSPELDAAAFEPAREFAHGSQSTEARTGPDGKKEVVTMGLGGKREPFTVHRVIGVSPLRQFLVAAPGGRLQTLEAAWDPHRNEWFNVYGNEDRKPGEWGHWTGRGMTWNTMCASCHNTRVRKNYDLATDSFRTSMAEMTVSCESCHGPLKAHVEWRTKYPGSRDPDPTVEKLSKTQTLDTCGSCHSRRGELTGDFKPGDSFWDHHRLSFTDESDLFHPDGQIRDEVYEFSSFLSSKMHAAGVTCLDCHKPHTGKTILMGNALCMRCHNGATPGAPVINLATHTFHAPESAGSQCVNCHMPQTVYMQRHWRRDHGFTIPDPLLTVEHGIPNACNRCHQDKDAAWALEASNQWWGEKMNRPARTRAQLFASARKREATAQEGLLKLLETDATSPGGEEQPIWKAGAIRLLEPWLGDPAVMETILRQTNHQHPLVRETSVRALEPLVERGHGAASDAVRKALVDPSRNVRIAAAWGFRRTIDEGSRAGRELLHQLAHNADQPLGMLQLGAYQLARGRGAEALEAYQTAVAWDPNSGGLRHELAVVLAMAGRHAEALQQLKEAVRLEPESAEFQYKLALAWNENGRPDEALEALEKAVKLDPTHARAWYNLGLARNGAGEVSGAIGALSRAEASDPRDARIPYARATIHARIGQTAEARAAAQKALQIQPGYHEAEDLLRALGGRGGR